MKGQEEPIDLTGETLQFDSQCMFWDDHLQVLTLLRHFPWGIETRADSAVHHLKYEDIVDIRLVEGRQQKRNLQLSMGRPELKYCFVAIDSCKSNEFYKNVNMEWLQKQFVIAEDDESQKACALDDTCFTLSDAEGVAHNARLEHLKAVRMADLKHKELEEALLAEKVAEEECEQAYHEHVCAADNLEIARRRLGFESLAGRTGVIEERNEANAATDGPLRLTCKPKKRNRQQNNLEYKYECPICFKRFEKKCGMTLHTTKMHKADAADDEFDGPVSCSNGTPAHVEELDDEI